MDFKLIIGIAIAIVLIVGVGVFASGSMTTTTSSNPSKIYAEVINENSSSGEIYSLKIKLTASDLPEGQKNYFKVVGNLNGTPADELWFMVPEGSKLANGMIITINEPNDLRQYDSFTIYLYDKPDRDDEGRAIERKPITNITVNNTIHI